MTWETYTAIAVIFYISVVIGTIHDETVKQKPIATPWIYVILGVLSVIWPCVVVFALTKQLFEIWQWSKRHEQQ